MRKIRSSGIAEVVIAISIIAICIGIASIVFVRANASMTDFESLNLETEAQNLVWEKLFEVELVSNEIDYEENIMDDSLTLLRFTRGSEVIFEQDIYINE